MTAVQMEISILETWTLWALILLNETLLVRGNSDRPQTLHTHRTITKSDQIRLENVSCSKNLSNTF